MRRITSSFCSKNKISFIQNYSIRYCSTPASIREDEFNFKYVSTNPTKVIEKLMIRGASADQIASVEEIKLLHTQKNRLTVEKENFYHQRKVLSKEINDFIKADKIDEADKLKKIVFESKEKLEKIENQFTVIDEQVSKLFANLPNIFLDPRVPNGKSEEDNKIVDIFFEDQRKIGDNYLWHDEIIMKLGGWGQEEAIKLSGTRFSILKNKIAKLERALSTWMLELHTEKHGYEEISVPLIVSKSILEGTAQIPKFQNDLFATNHTIAGEDSFLIPTAEVPLTNLHKGDILQLENLPLKYVALSPCFRAEAGSNGRDTRGLLRLHQFNKVELVKITTPERSVQDHEELALDCEQVLRLLKIPYRKVVLCSGDIGFSANFCYDLEVWLPGQQKYREISSISNCGDFQARKIGLKYRPVKNQKPQFCHTINGSGVAVGRALVAVLETYQQPDGSVIIPDVLQPYMKESVLYPISK
eukprot:c16733_g1_i1.p1 GENE.c16733_g1_i1~~c16733_g1_i1.p1  ORF type:complete len:486 (+),score=181.15 c16733_g1_i1:40-1458(+)